MEVVVKGLQTIENVDSPKETEQRLAQKMRNVADRQFTEPSELEACSGDGHPQSCKDVPVRQSLETPRPMQHVWIGSEKD
eukprot:2959187-Amphidinium_carterae.1